MSTHFVWREWIRALDPADAPIADQLGKASVGVAQGTPGHPAAVGKGPDVVAAHSYIRRKRQSGPAQAVPVAVPDEQRVGRRIYRIRRRGLDGCRSVVYIDQRSVSIFPQAQKIIQRRKRWAAAHPLFCYATEDRS